MSETDKAATRAEAAKSEPVEPEAPAVPAKEGEEEQAPMPPIKDEHDLPATPPLDPTGDTADGRMPHPAVIEHAPEHVAAAQVEKHAAAQRELHGRPPKGTVVLGLEDEKLWAMRRRFDSSVLHTLSPPTNLPRGEPDLRPSTLPNVPFSQDELRSNLERFYALIVVDGAGLAHHMSRLMWWQEGERRRSAAFAVAYFTSCIFNMATPFILLLLIVLIVSPRSRHVLFPAAKPKEHSLPDAVPTSKGHKTTPLGIPTEEAGEQLSKAEQAEQHAFEMTNIVQRFGVRVLVGGKQKSAGNAGVGRKRSANAMPSSVASAGESSSSEDEDDQVDHAPAQDALEAKKDEEALTPKERKAKARAEKKRIAREAKIKRDALVGQIAKQLQDVFGALADMLEVVQNTLNPPPGFPSKIPRMRLAGAIFVPLLLVTASVPAHWYAKGASFGAGIAFFGQPLLRRAGEWTLKQLNARVPDWKQRVDPRNSILSGVPTDNQVVLHLLRQSEKVYRPLPPAPKWPADGSVQSDIQVDSIDPTSVDSDAAHAEAGIHPDAADGEGTPEDEQTKEKAGLTRKAGVKALSGLRGVAKKAATFRGDVEITAPVKPEKAQDDRTLQQKAVDKVDQVFIKSKAKDEGSVDAYPAKLNNNSGYLTIEHSPSSGAPATLTFYSLKKPDAPSFKQPVGDLVEIKKVGVWVGRAVLGWAAAVQLEGRGLVMRFKSAELREHDTFAEGHGDEKHDEMHEGEVYTFTQVERRDQLFARLLAVGGQKWELL